jgi:hypothetical protein
VYRKLALAAAAVVIGVVVVAAWAGTTSAPEQRFVLGDLGVILKPPPSVPEDTQYGPPQLATLGEQDFAEDPELALRTRVRSGYTATFESDELVSASAVGFLFDGVAAARNALEPLRAAARADAGDFQPVDPLPFGGWGLIADFGSARAIIYGWSRANAVLLAAIVAPGAFDEVDATQYAREIDARAAARGR